MTEVIENAIQIVTTGICMLISVRKGIVWRSREWIILALASGIFFLGDLYWELFLVIYGRTPEYSYIPYLSWYASYLFLLLLLIELGDGKKGSSHWKILWVIPVFTAGMCVFYLQWGDWLGNIITAVFMSLLMWYAGDRLLSEKERRKIHPESGRGAAGIYAAVLLFCLTEYAAWTASCFGNYDTWAHPYIWFDIMLSAVFLLFPAALEKAVGR